MMNALALFPHDAPLVAAPIAEPTDADLDARTLAYVARRWFATPDDARQIAEAVVYRAVEDLADHRPRKRTARASALLWLRSGDEDACGIAWCAAALGLPLDALRGDIAERVAVREAEKDAHAEDLRRRRRRVRGWSVARSSFAGHVLLAALVTRVMGGEWES